MSEVTSRITSKISPCMWFDGEAEEAANLYVSLFSDSHVDHVQRNVVDGPAGRAGTVLVVGRSSLRALKLADGQPAWPEGTVSLPTGGVTSGRGFYNGDRYFLFNEQGELIICKLTPDKYDEVSRMKILKPTNILAGRPVVWTHPAFANKNCYARNDKEIVCVSLRK